MFSQAVLRSLLFNDYQRGMLHYHIQEEMRPWQSKYVFFHKFSQFAVLIDLLGCLRSGTHIESSNHYKTESSNRTKGLSTDTKAVWK